MKNAAIILLVNVLYGFIGFLLYRGRVQTQSPILGSDVVIFLVPALLALAFNGLFIWKSFPKWMPSWLRGMATLFCACTLTFLAFWGYMLAGVNLYGE